MSALNGSPRPSRKLTFRPGSPFPRIPRKWPFVAVPRPAPKPSPATPGERG